MNSISLNKESENISQNQTSDPISDQILGNISKLNQKSDSSVTMVSTSFVSNGCDRSPDLSVISSNAYKASENGFIDPNISTGSSSSGSTNVSVVSTGSQVSNGDISVPNNGNASNHSMSWFALLSGEVIRFKGSTTEGLLIVTNFRVLMSYNSPKDRLPICFPICMIESIELREIYYLYVYTKPIRSFIFVFSTGDECSLWSKRLLDVCAFESKPENLFCFQFLSATKSENKTPFLVEKQIRNSYEIIYKEFKRMSFDSVWRISDINKEFKLCSSYPQYLIVPQTVNDKDLESVANFRYSRRIPTAVWKHRTNGCVIARSSQPEVGWLGWRNNQDEHLLQSIVMSCSLTSDQNKNQKLLILDARSYTAAVANRAKGGGCECPEYYLSSEVQFMSLANIHSIRKSFHSLRYICESPADQFNWLTLLDNSKWLHNISALLKSALIVVNAIDLEERPVLVHCSDGWDRTPQIVALAELMLDSYYRTIEGFRVLIEREWIQFGHKFADRCGQGASSEDINERCPVFLQWLDCVHQLVLQFPCSFEFNLHFLIKLIQHTYSCLFGTFICNNMQQRLDHQIYERTFSVWSYFNSRRQQFVNYVYVPNEQVLRPSCKAKDIVFWSDVYMPLSSSVSETFRQNCCPESVVKENININTNGIEKDLDIELKPNNSELNVSNNETNETESDMDTIASDKHHSLSKTRSCENIALDDHHCNQAFSGGSPLRTRHCSYPNLFGSLSIADQIEWETMKCADIVKYIRDLQSNGLSVNRDSMCDRDSNLMPLNCDSEMGLLEDSDLGMSAHFSMLSTETLLNGNNSSYLETIDSSCNPLSINTIETNVVTTSTSTTELSNSCVQSNDLTVQFDRLYNSVYCQKKKQLAQTSSTPIQRQSSNENNSSNNVCNGNGKHTRTPSSGCPATPNDEQIFEAFPFDGALSQEIFDIDGHVLLRDKGLVRLQQIIGQNKNEIEYLKRELYLARLALCQQLKYCNGVNDENSIPIVSHSFDFLSESPSLDSWVEVINNKNGFATKCDTNNSFSPFNSIPIESNNTSACDDSKLDSNSITLNHL